MAKAKDKPIPVESLPDEARDLYEAIRHEHPLPCVLISVSFIEQCLKTLLHAHFVASSTTANEILDHEKGVLKDISSRAKLAYCLGMIDKPFYSNLCTLGAIRNKFAHSHLAIEFEDQAIADLCLQLTLPTAGQYIFTEYGPTDGSPFRSISPWQPWSHPRNRFASVVALMVSSLVTLAKSASRCVTPLSMWSVPSSMETDGPMDR